MALRFGLNAENCPRHPSFCTETWVLADFERGEQYYILQENGAAIGCVAYESPCAGLAYLNRLSVLPSHRKKSAGEKLVRHVINHARSAGIDRLSIGVIAGHVELRRWYVKLGFNEGETKSFPHLPFAVSYLNYAVETVGR